MVFLLLCRFPRENMDLFDILNHDNQSECLLILLHSASAKRYLNYFLLYAWLEVFLGDLLNRRGEVKGHLAHCCN